MEFSTIEELHTMGINFHPTLSIILIRKSFFVENFPAIYMRNESASVEWTV